MDKDGYIKYMSSLQKVPSKRMCIKKCILFKMVTMEGTISLKYIAKSKSI